MWSPRSEILLPEARPLNARVYQWTDNDDDVAWDAIIVGIASDAEAFERAGLTPAEPLASIYWPDWISQGDKVTAALEGPYEVAEALERVEELCALWAYNRVVVSIQLRSLWKEEWGRLADEPGFD